MPKQKPETRLSATTSVSEKNSFTFFSQLPQREQGTIQENILHYLSASEMAAVAQTSRDLFLLAPEASSDYQAAIRGQEIVDFYFKGCECDFIYIPNLPENVSLNEYLLNAPPLTANAAFALVLPHEFRFLSSLPTERDVQQITSQEVLVYFDEDKFKYIVKNGVEQIRGEVELQLEDAVTDNDGRVVGYSIHRQGLKQKYFAELREGIEKLSREEKFTPSEAAVRNFVEQATERKHLRSEPTIFYVDRLSNSTHDDFCSPAFLEEMIDKFAHRLPPPNTPMPLNNNDVREIEAFFNYGYLIHQHAEIKAAFSNSDVYLTIGKNFLRFQDAFKLYKFNLLSLCTSDRARYALENGLLTAENFTTLPPLPAGGAHVGIVNSVYRQAHRTLIETLLSPTGIQALERKLISVPDAHSFLNETLAADSSMPGNSFRALFNNEAALIALERGWLSLENAAHLSFNGSLRELLTPLGLELLQLIHEDKDAPHPRVRIEEIRNFRAGYQLKSLLNNPHFLPALRAGKIRLSNLNDIQNENSSNLLLSPPGLEALEKGFMTTDQISQLGDANYLAILLSPRGMQAFDESLITMDTVIATLQFYRSLDQEQEFAGNLRFLLSEEGFFLLHDRYTTFDIGIGTVALSSFITPPMIEAIKVVSRENLLKFADIYELSIIGSALVSDLLSNAGIERLRRDTTLIQTIKDHQQTSIARAIPIVENICLRLPIYLEQLITIREGMAQEYPAAKEMVIKLINSVNNVNNALNYYQIDSPHLVKKLDAVHQIQSAFKNLNTKLTDPYMQNAIEWGRFPSSGMLTTLMAEFTEDQALQTSFTQISALQNELSQQRLQEQATLHLTSARRRF